MAAAEKIKALINSFSEGDEESFYAIAMQIAAAESRRGHTKVAKDIKTLIQRTREKRSDSAVNNVFEHPISSQIRDIEDLIEFSNPRVKLNHLVLDDDVRQALNRVINEQQKFDKLLQYDLIPRRKLLFTGPPGCGKTMSAEALAGELALPLFTIRLDGLISRYMGETIVKLKKVFNFMNTKRGVFLFDEFDSIGTTRSAGNDVGEIKRVLNSFLLFIEKDHSNSLIIAATNYPEILDRALYRRFDDIISYSLPGTGEITRLIFERFGKSEKIAKQEAQKISEVGIGLSHADIVRACDEAMKEKIILDRESISIADIEHNLERRKQTL